MNGRARSAPPDLTRWSGTAVVSGLFYAEAFVFPLVAAQAPDLLGPPPFTAFLAPV